MSAARERTRTPPGSVVDSEQANVYRYRHLRGLKWIRILELLPGYDTQPRCRIQEVSLDDAPNYDAVSYVWGSPNLTKRIHIGSKFLYVTENCYHTLRALRDDRLPRFYWIDACCIDQLSTKERSHQVGLMGEIYSKATRTIVWLGKPQRGLDHDDARAIRYIEDVAQGAPAGQQQSHQMEKDINHFMDKPWFHRVWTVQEFALAQRCIIMCGAFRIDAGVLLTFLEKKQHKMSRIDRLQRVQLHQQMWMHFHENGKTTRDLNTRHAQINTAKCTRLLLGARSQSSSDPKDKIFAFHGILDRLNIQLPAPDYTKRINQVYREAAAASIHHDQSLMLLSSLTGESSTTGLPSWVPDWSDNRFITAIACWDEKYAIKTKPPDYLINDSNKCLEVDGFIIDTITYSSQDYPAFHSLRHEADRDTRYAARRREVAVLKTWFAAFEDANAKNVPVFFSSLVEEAWDQERQQSSLPSEVLAMPWIKAIKLIGLTASALHDLPKRITEVLKETNHSSRTKSVIESAMIPFHSTMRTLLDRKRMFKSRGGKLGMGCRALRMGDKIALVSGCNLPMIIRLAQNKSDWHIVCPAFLENEMRGGSQSRSELRLKKFTFI